MDFLWLPLGVGAAEMAPGGERERRDLEKHGENREKSLPWGFRVVMDLPWSGFVS